MRTIKLFLPLLLLALLALPASRAAERGQATTVRGILIIASNEPGKADPRLADYEGILQGALRFFRSFRFIGESSTPLPAGGRATLDVQGNRIDLQSAAG